MINKTILFLAISAILITGTLSVGQTVFSQKGKADKNDNNPFKQLWDAIDNLQSQIDLIGTGTRGPPGEQGPAGNDGQDGATGMDGADGTSCTIEGTVVSCTDGTSSDVQGPPGNDGSNGPPGSDGAPGEDGTSCSVEGTETGARIVCEDGTIEEIFDGQDETPGTTIWQDITGKPFGLDDGDDDTIKHIMRFEAGRKNTTTPNGTYINYGDSFPFNTGQPRNFNEAASMVGTDGTITHFRYHIGPSDSDGIIIDAIVYLNNVAIFECIVTSNTLSGQSCTANVSIPVIEGDLIAVADFALIPQGLSGEVGSRHATLTITS